MVSRSDGILKIAELKSCSAVGSTCDSKARGPGFVTQFVSSSADSRRAFVCYWRKYVREVLVTP